MALQLRPRRSEVAVLLEVELWHIKQVPHKEEALEVIQRNNSNSEVADLDLNNNLYKSKVQALDLNLEEHKASLVLVEGSGNLSQEVVDLLLLKVRKVVSAGSQPFHQLEGALRWVLQLLLRKLQMEVVVL